MQCDELPNADLKDIYDQNQPHRDTGLPDKKMNPEKDEASIPGKGLKRTHSPSPDRVSGRNNLRQPAETREQDPAHTARNKLFEERWRATEKSWESSEIDGVDKMHELHKFEQLADNASFETVQNIANLMKFMHMMKNNRAVQKTGTFAERATLGIFPKKTTEKFIRTVPHIFHAMSLSRDPDTKKITEGAFRLAFTPNLVDGDEEAGKKGLETKEVRLIRDSIRRLLEKSGFNPNTGELVDKNRIKSIQEERNTAAQKHNKDRQAAAQKRKDYFLNGLDALSVKKNYD